MHYHLDINIINSPLISKLRKGPQIKLAGRMKSSDHPVRFGEAQKRLRISSFSNPPGQILIRVPELKLRGRVFSLTLKGKTHNSLEPHMSRNQNPPKRKPVRAETDQIQPCESGR